MIFETVLNTTLSVLKRSFYMHVEVEDRTVLGKFFLVKKSAPRNDFFSNIIMYNWQQ